MCMCWCSAGASCGATLANYNVTISGAIRVEGRQHGFQLTALDVDGCVSCMDLLEAAFSDKHMLRIEEFASK